MRGANEFYCAACRWIGTKPSTTERNVFFEDESGRQYERLVHSVICPTCQAPVKISTQPKGD